MDSRDISRIERCMGLDMIVLRSGGVMNASEIAVSLYNEVMALRYYCDSGALARVDKYLDKQKQEETEEV